MKEEVDPVAVVAAFVGMAEEMEETIFAGIDPGATGAIAFLCGKRYVVVDIPTIITGTVRTKKTNKKERAATGHKTKSVEGHVTRFNYPSICAIFRLFREVKDRLRISLEEAPTSLGPGKHNAEIMLNRAYAMWPLFICSKGYPLEEVRPAEWKKAMGLLKKDKEVSRHKALALFPRADLLRKMDHNRAEALLIAEFLRRKTLREG